MVVISLLGAIFPAAFLLWYFYKLDRLKAEPKGLILKIFFLGVLFTFVAFIVEKQVIKLDGWVPSGYLWQAAFHAFLVAALVEESLKFLVVKIFAYNTVYFDEASDGMIYAITASLGFACMENILYVLNGGLSVALARAVSAVPLHAIASGLMGYYIGRAKFTNHPWKRPFFFVGGLGLAILIHGFYNFLIFALTPVHSLFVFVVLPYLLLLYFVLKKELGLAITSDVLNGRVVGDKLG